MSRIASRAETSVRLTGRLSRSDLLWVANTAHGAGGHWHARAHGGEPEHDHLGSPEEARRYLADHRVPVPGVPPDPAAMAELATLRALVQARVDPVAPAWTVAGLDLLAAARWAIEGDGRIADARPGWAGFCSDLLVSFLALVEEGVRLQRCANPSCRLVFEDSSRNHARRWCDTAGCGNRDRVRRARVRAGGHEDISQAQIQT